jgi:hypothetical protein
MKSIMRRIQRLEAMVSPDSATEFSPPLRRGRGRRKFLGAAIPAFKIRMGPLQRLPKDYPGERHVIIARHLPDCDNREWVEYEEVAGSAPSLPPQDSHLPRYLDVMFVAPYPQPS